jgi:hypothetical protein
MATDVIARGMASNSLKEAKAYTDTFNSQVTNIAPTSDGTGLIFTVIGGQTFTIGVDDWNALTDDEKNKIAIIDSNGDGTKYLADDGEYKTISGVSPNYDTLTNKPQINSMTLEGDVSSSNLGIKTSDLTNDSNFVSDESYVHTDNNFTNDEKTQIQANANNIGVLRTDVSTNTADISLLDDQVNQLNNYVGYFPNNVIGLHVDFQNMEFERLAGAVGLTAGADFNKFNMYGGRRRCLLADDGVVIAYNDGTQYVCNDSNGTIVSLVDGESGLLTTEVIINGTTYAVGTKVQVMVEQPKFYYKVVPLALDKVEGGKGFHMRKANYYLSDTMKTGFKIHPAFVSNGKENNFIYMSAYEGCTFDTSASAYKLNDAQDVDWTNDVLASICGAKPTSGLTQSGATRAGFRTIAAKRGSGWSQETVQAATATELLFLVEYASFDTQSKIGIGVTNKIDDGKTNMAEITGATTTLGNATGFVVNTNGWNVVSYRGEENPYGNIWKWIDGINIYNYNEGSVHIADHGFVDNSKADPYKDAGITIAGEHGYVSAFAYNEDFDWLFIASEVLGNSSLPVGDYFYQHKATSAYKGAMLGGRWSHGSIAGGFCWGVSNDSSIPKHYLGGRLVYVPQ